MKYTKERVAAEMCVCVCVRAHLPTCLVYPSEETVITFRYFYSILKLSTRKKNRKGLSAKLASFLMLMSGIKSLQETCLHITSFIWLKKKKRKAARLCRLSVWMMMEIVRTVRPDSDLMWTLMDVGEKQRGVFKWKQIEDKKVEKFLLYSCCISMT